MYVLGSISLLVLMLVFKSFAEERIRFNPRPCIDCIGNRISPGEMYFDGCNVCRCDYWNQASCTNKWCRWNMCNQNRPEETDRDDNERQYY